MPIEFYCFPGKIIGPLAVLDGYIPLSYEGWRILLESRLTVANETIILDTNRYRRLRIKVAGIPMVHCFVDANS